MSDDPLRFRDDPEAPPSMRDDLSRAAGSPPIRYDGERGLARLLAAIGPGAGGPDGGGGPAGPPPGAAAGGAGAAAAKGGLLAAAKSGAAIGALAALGLVGAGAAWVAMTDAADRPAPSAIEAAPVASSELATPAPPANPTVDPGAPGGVAATPPAGSAAGGAPPPHAEVRPAASAAPAAPSEPSPATPAGDRVAEETAHLARLRAAAPVDPAAALRLADEGEQRFAGGVFSQEREAIAIGALARLGRAGEARARAEAFVARHPGSPLAESVRRAGGLP